MQDNFLRSHRAKVITSAVKYKMLKVFKICFLWNRRRNDSETLFPSRPVTSTANLWATPVFDLHVHTTNGIFTMLKCNF